MQQKARLAQSTTTPEELSGPSPVKAAEATGALPSFRWPVRGRVITAYGAKTNGKANDGINLAVPEGTPVKAADDGVVAYSGNELKGYGNLVLIRHANGYVTAYAHASELLVKRGDKVKRGQVIAKSGRSGARWPRRRCTSGTARAIARRSRCRSSAARKPAARHPPPSSPGLTGRPSILRRRCLTARPRRTGTPAFAALSRRMTDGTIPATWPPASRRGVSRPADVLDELPGDAAGTRSARRRPFDRLARQLLGGDRNAECSA